MSKKRVIGDPGSFGIDGGMTGGSDSGELGATKRVIGKLIIDGTKHI